MAFESGVSWMPYTAFNVIVIDRTNAPALNGNTRKCTIRTPFNLTTSQPHNLHNLSHQYSCHTGHTGHTSPPPMAKRSLLLCFDAFGTLFRLKQPIERQYGDIARRQFGLTGLDDDAQLKAAFRAAFKAQSRAHPNYGRTTGAMGAAAWWTQVIHATFRPLLGGSDGDVPPGLAPQLLARFASSEGYTMAAEVPTLLRALQLQQQRPGSFYDRVVVGVITNSDDRVPGILASFGLRVSPLRYGDARQPSGTTTKTATATATTTPIDEASAADIDFHCMSYDVGVEKPDVRIFRAAETLLPAALARRGEQMTETELNLDHWDKVYVGDEVRKDVEGAHAAGWHPVLLLDKDRDGDTDNSLPRNAQLRHLEDCPPQPLGRLFGQPQPQPQMSHTKLVVGVDSVASLIQWLLRGREEEET